MEVILLYGLIYVISFFISIGFPLEIDFDYCLNNFLEDMTKIITESQRILKPDKYLCILIGDVVRKGQFISLTRKLANICEDLGLEDCGNAIKITKDSVSQRRRGKAIYAELAKTKNLKQNHDTILFLKKVKDHK